MQEEVFRRIKFDNELSCTKTEFENYIENIDENKIELPEISHEANGFNTEYNGKKIDNPTGDPNAIYYVLKFGDTTYLQPHKPFVQGHEAITSQNYEEVVEGHVQQLKERFIENKKIKKAINHFK